MRHKPVQRTPTHHQQQARTADRTEIPVKEGVTRHSFLAARPAEPITTWLLLAAPNPIRINTFKSVSK